MRQHFAAIRVAIECSIPLFIVRAHFTSALAFLVVEKSLDHYTGTSRTKCAIVVVTRPSPDVRVGGVDDERTFG